MEEAVVEHRRDCINRIDRQRFLILLWGSVILLSSLYAFVYVGVVADAWGYLAFVGVTILWCAFMFSATVGRWLELKRTRYAFRVHWFWKQFWSDVASAATKLYNRFLTVS